MFSHEKTVVEKQKAAEGAPVQWREASGHWARAPHLLGWHLATCNSPLAHPHSLGMPELTIAQCGEQRPQCQQCTRSNRSCPGYRRNPVFIQVNPAASSESSPQHHLSLIRTAYQQQLLGDFHEQYIPDIDHVSESRSWLSALLQLPFQTKASKASGLALCTAMLGRTRANPGLVRESLDLYTRGLRELQLALLSPSMVRHDETLAACLALAMYEIMECPGRQISGYYHHCRGLMSLIKLRGVDAHKSGFGHQLFLAIRAHGIMYDLGQLTPSFMANRVWIEKPWENTTKSPSDRITDCMAHLPRLFHDIETYTSLSCVEKEAMALDLIADFQFLDTSLQDIYNELKGSKTGPLYWSSLSRDFNSADPMKGPLFPIAFQFPDLKTAGNLMTYWATCALIWNAWNSIYEDFRHVAHGKITISPRDISSVIVNVCQSAEFCLHGTKSVRGGYIATMPLAICKEILQSHGNQPQQVEWIQRALKALENRGARILKYI
ncbi:uncharacterized protein N7498_009941 [Penicillium cinerascens]|uniref:Zn(2)-C6 fungal-type domain-containing protein n=1 Tax=Penicillium cinerascens TaxID=70096 RepID=A0A9W9J820_9EURO|nr:uncharacterized protein N7498_009941 [Penicillium cinerascens]KAJ5190956.1 hypothetical protein N7498_009941 [Penicillium cinerascens]